MSATGYAKLHFLLLKIFQIIGGEYKDKSLREWQGKPQARREYLQEAHVIRGCRFIAADTTNVLAGAGRQRHACVDQEVDADFMLSIQFFVNLKLTKLSLFLKIIKQCIMPDGMKEGLKEA